MPRSLGMAAYHALARRSGVSDFTPHADRPAGEVIWIHAEEPEKLLAVLDMAHRISAARYQTNILITLPDQKSFDEARDSLAPLDGMLLDMIPGEHPKAIKAFWSHWRPQMGLWTFGRLRPNLIQYAHDTGCPMVLVDGEKEGFESARERWIPDLSRQLLDPFQAIMVRSDKGRKKLLALGFGPERIDFTPPLQASGQVLPCEDSDLAELSQVLSGRPVWLANMVLEEELDTVLRAHRQAFRLSHRLLLVLHPARADETDAFKRQIADFGLRLADWAEGEEPDDATQVLLSTDSGDLGVFYRIAPVSFMGSSLFPGHRGRNPYEAAALGSAVLYGPNVRRYMPFYSRLAKAGAARIVKDADTLGAAVSRLIAPEQAAAMAHAGWDIISEGADLMDQVADLVNATLDGDRVEADART